MQWPHCATALDAWYRLMKAAEPQDFAAMQRLFPAVDKVGEFHVFDIGGNKLRLIAIVLYRARRVYVRYILDHTDHSRGKWRKGQ